jgi:uncharacterized membrane protein YgdD (TMEM256/DUF423 family)
MIVSKQTKVFFSIAAFMMALAISIGAFGAHGLKPYLDAYGLEIYTKATSYQFYNTLGLFAIAVISFIFPNAKKIKLSYILVFIGMIIFSFSLYTLALTKIMWLGATTPIGGSLMIVGWLLLSYNIYKEI